MKIFQAASEVENLKSQMMTLFKDLQQAQSKLDEAEGMKKNLQDRLGPHTHTLCSKSAYAFSNQNISFVPFNLLTRRVFR